MPLLERANSRCIFHMHFKWWRFSGASAQGYIVRQKFSLLWNVLWKFGWKRWYSSINDSGCIQTIFEVHLSQRCWTHNGYRWRCDDSDGTVPIVEWFINLRKFPQETSAWIDSIRFIFRRLLLLFGANLLMFFWINYCLKITVISFDIKETVKNVNKNSYLTAHCETNKVSNYDRRNNSFITFLKIFQTRANKSLVQTYLVAFKNQILRRFFMAIQHWATKTKQDHSTTLDVHFMYTIWCIVILHEIT